MQMAHDHEIDRARVEAAASIARRSRALIAPISASCREALADPGLDEDAARRRLDEQAVQRLEERCS